MDETLLCFHGFGDTFMMDAEGDLPETQDPTTESKLFVSGYTVPEYSEMETEDCDDFSWLLKVLPPEDNEIQMVPGSDADTFTQCRSSVHGEKDRFAMFCQEEQNVSMLLDPFLSNMDVTSLISLDETIDSDSELQSPLEKAVEISEEKARPAITNSQGRRSFKTLPNLIKIKSESEGEHRETPPVRRSVRKRSYHDMINEETVTPKPSEVTTKRKKIDFHKGAPAVISNSPTLALSNTKANDTGNMITTREESIQGGLKMTFRKHKPVNPLDNIQTYQRWYNKGLIDPRKNIAGELYYKHTIRPRTVPHSATLNTVSFAVANPLNRREVKHQVKLEWIRNHNEIANRIAHGNGQSGAGKTAHVKRSITNFAIMNIDKGYSELLIAQKDAYAALMQNEKKLPHDSKESLDKPFLHMPNNNGVDLKEPDPQVNKFQKKLTSFRGLVGAVPVDASKCSANFLSNRTIFPYKGHLYRANPVVVSLVRLDHAVIEEMQARPRRITSSSKYYTALTSYFDKTTASSSSALRGSSSMNTSNT